MKINLFLLPHKILVFLNGNYSETYLKSLLVGSPGGAVVKNLPVNAGDTGSFDPCSWKIPHAAEQLSPCATTTEHALWSPRATTTEPACHNY